MSILTLFSVILVFADLSVTDDSEENNVEDATPADDDSGNLCCQLNLIVLEAT